MYAARRGARERIVSASQQLFRDQGINSTGMDQLCAVAEVFDRHTETAREAGATKPEQLGEQLALLLDGTSARNRVLKRRTHRRGRQLGVGG